MSDMNSLPPLALPLTDAPQSSYTLPAAYYLEPEIFEREKTEIFYKTWQYVAHKSAFTAPGDYVGLRICDQNIFVIQGDDGRLRAFYNVCRHRAHELLSAPSGNVGSLIVCPYHAWGYERDGRLRGARFTERRDGFNKADFGLREVRLEEYLNCIFVNLDDRAESMADLAGDMADDVRARVPYLDALHLVSLDTGTLGDTAQQAGWKVVVDNFVECYHCRYAHPDFASLITMNEYELAAGPLWTRQSAGAIRHANSAYPVDPGTGFQSAVFWYLWPNTTFNIMPGANEMAVYAIRPLSLEACSFEGHVLSCDAKPNAARSAYAAQVLAPEDIALCESVQRGLKSKGCDQGPIITGSGPEGQTEYGIHHFHRLVQRALNGT